MAQGGPGVFPFSSAEVANVELGPDMRRGIAELNGEGETVGGIVIVRYGANARQVILDVKKKLDTAMKRTPSGCDKYTIAYDRSSLITRAVKTLRVQTPRGKPRGRARLPGVPDAPAQFPRRHHHPADCRPRLISGHVWTGHQLKHHVARRHRHRHRGDGGRHHHHDRKRPQTP